MNVPLLDLKAQFQPLRAEIMAEIQALSVTSRDLSWGRASWRSRNPLPGTSGLAMRSVAPPGAMRCCSPSWPWE